MTFVGPLKVEDKRTGIYISKIKEGGAAHDTAVKVGMKILAMNGQPMVLALKSEASGSLKNEETAIMTLQFDPQGFATYDGVRVYLPRVQNPPTSCFQLMFVRPFLPPLCDSAKAWR